MRQSSWQSIFQPRYTDVAFGSKNLSVRSGGMIMIGSTVSPGAHLETLQRAWREHWWRGSG